MEQIKILPFSKVTLMVFNRTVRFYFSSTLEITRFSGCQLSRISAPFLRYQRTTNTPNLGPPRILLVSEVLLNSNLAKKISLLFCLIMELWGTFKVLHS